MMLDRMQTRVRETFGPDFIWSIAHLLAAWMQSPDAKWLKTLVHDTGLDYAALESGMATRVKQNQLDPMDREIIKRALAAADLAGGIGLWVIIDELCQDDQHALTREWLKLGLKPAVLRQNISGFVPPALLAAGVAAGAVAPDSPLLRFGRDLLAKARQGLFDHLVERTDVTDSIMQVLLRQQKGHAILLGAAGVGKTAIMECFAAKLARGQVDAAIRDFKLFEISISQLVAGTQYRGMFEERVNQVVTAAQEAEPIILFLDEMHLLVGSGRAEGVIMDGANILKPILARGKIRFVGATTPEEYQETIARDSALARRFQTIAIQEPDGELIAKMVNAAANSLSAHHGIAISPAVLESVIRLSDVHILNRRQPDKSIDLLDSLCVQARQQGRQEIAEQDILKLIARQTHKALDNVDGSGKKELATLAKRLQQDVIGQDEALSRIANRLIHNRLTPNDEHKPLGAFLFCGESGVGKTETAKSIARHFFNNEKALLQLDMAEYQDGSGIGKLLGHSSGAGFYQQGAIAKFVSEQGSGVILLDEIEKAHPSIQLLFLSLLDEGRITTNDNNRLDARACVIVLTTNAIRNAAVLSSRSIGFGKQAEQKELVDELLSTFPREFLARLHEIILFKPLTEEHWGEILLLHSRKAFARLEKKAIKIVYREAELRDFLLGKMRDLKGGARQLTRLIELAVLQPIALALLEYEESGLTVVKLDERFYQQGELRLQSQEAGRHD